MSDEAFQSPITDVVKGKQISFERLRNSEFGTLEQEIKQDRLRHMNAMLDQCKLTGRDRFESMADRYSPWINDAQIAGYLQTLKGAVSAVKLSLKAGGVDDVAAMEIISAYSVPDLMNLALALAGFLPRAVRDENGTLIPRPAGTNGDAKGGKAEMPADPTESQRMLTA